ncbi:PsiF family protein [Comamonadaceae bacterium PP-2]
MTTTRASFLYPALSAVVCLLALATPVHAADRTAQQSLMATCNQQATGKTGDDRKAFMKSCLSNSKLRQQEKMKTCNASATGLKGDERKQHLSECLKK